jgi:hypothetical protein
MYPPLPEDAPTITIVPNLTATMMREAEIAARARGRLGRVSAAAERLAGAAARAASTWNRMAALMNNPPKRKRA